MSGRKLRLVKYVFLYYLNSTSINSTGIELRKLCGIPGVFHYYKNKASFIKGTYNSTGIELRKLCGIPGVFHYYKNKDSFIKGTYNSTGIELGKLCGSPGVFHCYKNKASFIKGTYKQYRNRTRKAVWESLSIPLL